MLAFSNAARRKGEGKEKEEIVRERGERGGIGRGDAKGEGIRWLGRWGEKKWGVKTKKKI